MLKAVYQSVITIHKLPINLAFPKVFKLSPDIKTFLQLSGYAKSLGPLLFMRILDIKNFHLTSENIDFFIKLLLV